MYEVVPERLLGMRLDEVGVSVRQKLTIDLVSEVLVGDRDDRAAEWWRAAGDRLDRVGEGEIADACRGLAALIEEARL